MLSSRRRYRLMEFQRQVGPWRDSSRDVLDDAVTLGMGDRDPLIGAIFITVPAWIDSQPVPKLAVAA